MYIFLAQGIANHQAGH